MQGSLITSDGGVTCLCDVHIQVESDGVYSIALASRRAVYENYRAACFQQLLQGPLTTSEQLLNLGELLFQVQFLSFQNAC